MNLYLIIAAAFLIWSGGITTTAYFKGRVAGDTARGEICNKIINAQKAEAAEIMAAEVANVAATEKKLREFKDNREVQDAKNKQEVDVLSGRVRALSGIVGRLRDTTDAGCGESSNSPSDGTSANSITGTDNRGQKGRLLSASTSELFRKITMEADIINNAYISCREDSMNIRGLK